jgi:uncharacterized LabA/DUF88 family protein
MRELRMHDMPSTYEAVQRTIRKRQRKSLRDESQAGEVMKCGCPRENCFKSRGYLMWTLQRVALAAVFGFCVKSQHDSSFVVSFSWLPLKTKKLLLGAAFSLSGAPMSLRTAVFVDGYNLYYGRLRGTPFKWLDIVALCENLLAQRSQNETLAHVHLFSAHANASFATHGQASVEAQSAYHRALQALHGQKLSITYGTHSWSRHGTPMPTFEAGQAYDRNKRSLVWKIEEKLTDVNLALALYRSCSKGQCERIMLISNDRDAAPALQAIQEDFPHILRGLVLPVHPASGNTSIHPSAKTRRKSGTLQALCDWSVHAISDDKLQAAQLPAVVPVSGKKAITKPAHW